VCCKHGLQAGSVANPLNNPALTVLCVYRCVQMEAVWLQDFASRMPGYPDIGPCIVIKGRQPCCGLLPATHMTDNCHVAIPLRAMSKVGPSCCVCLLGLTSLDWLACLRNNPSECLLISPMHVLCTRALACLRLANA
jgi:hypothetical protein